MKKAIVGILAVLLGAAGARADEAASVTSAGYQLDVRPMPRAVAGGAQERIAYNPAWGGGDRVTVTVAAGDGAAETVVADAAAADAAVWTVPDVTGPALWTFTHRTDAGAEMTATFHSVFFELTVDGGEPTAVERGQEVTVPAPAYRGYRFVKWETAGVTLGDATADPAVFTMPEGDVTLTPVYEWAPEIRLRVKLNAAGDAVAVAATVAAYPAPGRVEGETGGTMRFVFENGAGNRTACATWATEPGNWAVTAADGGAVTGVWDLAADLGAGAAIAADARVHAEIRAGSAPVFATGGTYPWTEDTANLTPAGAASMKSGNKGVNSSTSTYTATVSSPGTLTFCWKVSSESASYDYLYYKVNGGSNVKLGGGYGSDNANDIATRSWATVSVTIRESDLQADGTATVTWGYTKDSSVNKGSDCALIGDIAWDGVATLATASRVLVGYPFEEENEGDGPDVPAAGGQSLFDTEAVYDGLAHTADVAGLAAMVAEKGVEGEVLAVRFLPGGAGGAAPSGQEEGWGEVAPSFVNAGTNVVWYKVSAAGYKDYVHAMRVVILRRAVTFASGSGSWAFDGAAHSNATVTVGGAGLVEGETAEFAGFAEITAVGTENNEFEVTICKGAGDQGDKEETTENYDITKVYGTLAVTTAGNPFVGGEDIDPVVPGEGDLTGAFSGFDTEAVYDGEAHSINTNALVEAVREKAIGEAVVKYWNAQACALTERPSEDALWLEIAPAFTNAGTNVVWYKVSATGCADYVHAAKVVILKRAVRLVSDSASWTFDGTAHRSEIVRLRGEGSDFVAGEAPVYGGFASITAVGTVDNVFTVTFADEVTAANYALDLAWGTLEVTTAANPFAGGDPDTPNPEWDPVRASMFDYVGVYDGAAHTVGTNALVEAVREKAIGGIAWKVEYCLGTGGAVPSRMEDSAPAEGAVWESAAPTFTDVGTNVVWYKVSAEGCADYVHKAVVVITKRPVELVSKSWTWKYTATQTAYTLPEVNVGAGSLVDGEVPTFGGFPVLTAVGTAENAFVVSDNGAFKVSNYDITKVFGTLEVVMADTPFPGGDPDPVNPGWTEGRKSGFDYVGVYDGAAHTLDVERLARMMADAARPAAVEVRYCLGRVIPGHQDSASGNGNTGDGAPPEGATWTDVAPSFTNAGTNVVWYKVSAVNCEDYVHAAVVIITKCPVTLTADSSSWVFDGQAHSNATVIVRGAGFVTGEGAEYAGFPTITEVGVKVNTFTATPAAGTDFANYEITQIDGQIEVTAAGNPFAGDFDPDRPGENWGPERRSGYDYTGVYDGEGHTIDTNELAGVVGEHVYAGVSVKVEYCLGTGGAVPSGQEAGWSEVAPCFTNAGTYAVWYRVRDVAEPANFAPYVHEAAVVIAKRRVTFASGSGSWTFDGLAHSNATVSVSGAGLVAGEEAEFAGFPVVTTVGEVSNTFTAKIYKGEEGTREETTENYEITVTNGVLTVTTAGNPFVGGEDIDPVVPPGGGEGGGNGDGDVTAAFSGFDTESVYDGEAKTIDVEGLMAKVAEKAIGEAVVEFLPGGAGGAAPSGQEAGWSEVTPAFANAGTNVVWYKVSAEGCADYVHAAKVVITRRPVTLTADSSSWVFDGAAHSNTTVIVRGAGFVSGEGAEYAGFPTITEVGVKVNAFTATAAAGTDFANYEITQIDGQIEVTAAGNPFVGDFDPDRPGAGWGPERRSGYDYTGVYDGEGHTIDTNELAGVVGEHVYAGVSVKVEYCLGTGGAVPSGQEAGWSEVAPCFTNAGNYVVWYRVRDVAEPANFAPYVHEAAVVIAKRRVTFTSVGGTWVYDGAAHANETVVTSGDGFAPGEGATFGDFTEVTDVCSNVPNAFSWTIRRADGSVDSTRAEVPETSNYEVAVTNGLLTVTTAPNTFVNGNDPDPVDPNWPEGRMSEFDTEAVYDGTAHTVDVEGLARVVADAAIPGAAWKISFFVEPRVENSLSQLSVPAADATWQSTAPGFVNAGTNVVWYKVSAAGCQDYVHAARVVITKRAVTFTSASASWTFDGQAHASTEVAVGGDGLAAGERAAFADFAEITAVGEAVNTFRVVGIYKGTRDEGEGTREETSANYDVTIEEGTLAVTTAGNPFVGGEDIDPVVPPGGGEGDGDGNGDGDLTAAFSGFDTESVYDGEGHTIDTNALVATVAEKAIGEAVVTFFAQPRIENALSGMSAPTEGAIWESTAPGFVNAGTNVVWYKVSAEGCADYVHAAKVVITKRPLAAEMIADIPDQVFDDEHPATEPAVVVTDGEPSIITADDYTVAYSQNTAPGVATVTVTATAGGNYQGSASRTFRIDDPAAARLRGAIAWKYLRESGTWFAQIRVVCTSGLVRGIEDLRFAFADRTSDGKRSAALWATLARGAVATTMRAEDGVTYRYVALDAARITQENSEVVYGVHDLSAATIPYAECVIELYVRKHVDPVTGNEAAADVDSFVGYLTWVSNGARVWLPVVADAAAVQTLEAARAPVSAASINTLMAVNVPPLTADSAPYCALTAFAVDGEEIRGRIAVGLAEGDGSRRAGSLGPNARVTVLGAARLGDAFTACGTVTVGADGTFTLPKPARAQFFKVRIEVEEVVR